MTVLVWLPLRGGFKSVVTALAAVRQRQENVANGARKGLRYGGYLVGSIVYVVGSTCHFDQAKRVEKSPKVRAIVKGIPALRSE